MGLAFVRQGGQFFSTLFFLVSYVGKAMVAHTMPQ